ncbi:hypothetical protein [Noviherbaspirillum sedimenti]|uniref:Uncharacterized protein n=1 Tax=Noviherbaspirillum sedimenti TaxID=2320865 RepID=A0A3A3G1I3_9BURK|nr:hypothetical protein [Noviherbaspirillum sedimenti]RJG00332.1 hypothetical protein D3878_01035 [Noviherbaspirillum sedimenti]
MSAHEIDGDALARAPLAEVTALLFKTTYGTPLRQNFEAVLRVVAVQLIAGLTPEDMAPDDAFRRGRDLLALLRSSA